MYYIILHYFTLFYIIFLHNSLFVYYTLCHYSYCAYFSNNYHKLTIAKTVVYSYNTIFVILKFIIQCFLILYTIIIIRAGNRLRFWNRLSLTPSRLKSVEVIRPIKSTNTGNSSHLMIKKASCHFHIVHYLPSHAWKVCLLE